MTPFHEKQCGNRGSHRENYLTEDVRYLNSQMYKNQTKIKEKSNFIVVGALQISTYRIKCSLTIDIRTYRNSCKLDSDLCLTKNQQIPVQY